MLPTTQLCPGADSAATCAISCACCVTASFFCAASSILPAACTTSSSSAAPYSAAVCSSVMIASACATSFTASNCRLSARCSAAAALSPSSRATVAYSTATAQLPRGYGALWSHCSECTGRALQRAYWEGRGHCAERALACGTVQRVHWHGHYTCSSNCSACCCSPSSVCSTWSICCLPAPLTASFRAPTNFSTWAASASSPCSFSPSDTCNGLLGACKSGRGWARVGEGGRGWARWAVLDQQFDRLDTNGVIYRKEFAHQCSAVQ